MNLHKISKSALGVLKYGLFLVLSMLTTAILYYNIHTPAERFLHALPVARLMVGQSLSVLLIVIISAFILDAAAKDRQNS